MNLEDLVKNGQKEEDAVYDVMTGNNCFYDLTYRIGNTAILENAVYRQKRVESLWSSYLWISVTGSRHSLPKDTNQFK